MAARSDHCPARHHFPLAPSRLLGNLGIRLMSPLARRTPQDQWRGPRAYIIVRMSRENFLWGAPRIHGELLKLGFVVSQATVSRYMPRRGYPPTQRWRTFLRNQAFAIGAIGFGRSRSAIRRPPRMVHASCPVRHQGAGWHALQAYRAIVDLAPVVAMSLFQSCRSALHPKALRARLLRGPPSKRHPLDLASRRLSPYRSRASPRRKLPGIRHTIIRYRAQNQADHNSFTAIALCVCHEQSETPQKACSKKVKIFKACRYLVIPPQFGYRGQGYDKRQGYGRLTPARQGSRDRPLSNA